MSPLQEQMLRIRMVELEIAKRYPQGKMRTPVHLSIGQEAAAVGVCAALGPDDLVVSTHRSHAHYLAKGGDLNAFIAELHGKATGCSGGFGGSMHLVDNRCGFMGSTSIVGGTIPIGVGMAFAKKLRRSKGIVVIFHGDAAVEEGVWHESANFVALHNLPVLFVCENNGMSCYTPLRFRQPRSNFKLLAEAHELAYSSCGSYSVDHVYSVARQSILKTPAFLEITCDRHYEHCGPAIEKHSEDEIAFFDGSRFTPEIERAFDLADKASWPLPIGMYP